MGAGAADIAEVVSDVRERLPGLALAPQLEPEQARFRLFDSITSFLRAASTAQPLVLVLEDLHWADRPSLLLLEFLARELAGSRLLVLMTYRDVEVSRQHPLSLTLGELTRERLFQRVLLRGLGRDDVGRFIALTTGAEPPAGLADAVFAHTEGNPLFVTEVVRLLVQEGVFAASAPPLPAGEGGSEGETRAAAHAQAPPAGAGQSSWTVRIPEGVREVIGRRLNRLSERCNQTLTLAAVIGRQFTLAQLTALSADISRERLVEVVEEALAARVVEELPRAAGQYQFTHALIQETLVAELSLTRRVQMHAQIAEALERLYGEQAEQHAAELAYHFGEAVSLLGPEKLVRYSLLAGERALAAYAYEEALDHFQRGVEAKTGQPPDAETAALLAGLGRTQVALLRLDDAFANLTRAFEIYRAAGDTQRAVSVAQVSVPPRFGMLSGVRQLLEGALELVPDDSLDAGRLQVPYAMARYYEEADDAAAQQLLESAVAIARRERDVALELQALGTAGWVDEYEMRYEASIEKCISVFEKSKALGNLLGQIVGAAGAGMALEIIPDLLRAHEYADAALLAAGQLRDRYWLGRAYLVSMLIPLLLGDWDRARDLGEKGLKYVPTEGRLLAFTGAAHLQLGETEAGRVYVERLIAAVRSLGAVGPSVDGVPLSMVIAIGSHTTGVAEYRAVAQEVTAAMLGAPLPPLYQQFARSCLAIQAVDAGDSAAAAEQYPQLRLFPRSVLPMLSDRVLGLVARTIGNVQAAGVHFEDALSVCRDGGLRPDYAWTCLEYAELLLDEADSGQPSAISTPSPSADDQARATALLDEGLQIARELGMRPLIERILSHRQILRA